MGLELNLFDRLAINDHTETWPAGLLDFMAPQTKVIYSDVDGTLLGPGGCLFVDENQNYTGSVALAVLQCHLHKVDVVMVSGRNRHQLFNDARILGFKNYVAELGCQIAYNLGEVVMLNVGDFTVLGETIWQAIEKSGAPQLLLQNFSGRLEYHAPWSGARECTHLLRGSIDVEAANSLLQDSGHDNLKVIDNGRVKRRSENLDPNILEVNSYHLLPKEAGKASAVRKDRETRGIPKEFCAAIGDSVADLELASEVGVLFLVKNAVIENPSILELLPKYPNVFVTHEAMGLGWAEAVGFLLSRNYR